mgnify:FL=1
MKITTSPEETISYASSMANFFQPGHVYGLRGDLASGKTTFIKGVLLGLNYDKVVNSPTFTLINEYDADLKVIHIDCYREDDINRWIDLGILEYFSSDYIVIIEWPEIIKPLLPNNISYIDFLNIDNNKRKITIL